MARIITDSEELNDLELAHWRSPLTCDFKRAAMKAVSELIQSHHSFNISHEQAVEIMFVEIARWQHNLK